MDLISVIVPVYKVETYLDRCVQSIVNQTYPNLEIILVDDGSPDNCPAMCDTWAEKDSRIKVIHKENGGLSDARNAGMTIASGEWIAFVDSDDWIHTGFMENLLQAARKTESDIAACDVQITSGDASSPAEKEHSLRICGPEEAIGDILEGKGFRAVAWNKLYKRTLLLHERYPVGRHHEDEFFTYRILAKADRLVYLDMPMYYYFQRPGSIMNSFSIKRLDALDAYLERIEFLKATFPNLYTKEKASFCVACVSFYRDIPTKKNVDTILMKKRIKEFRKKVSFCAGELSSLTPKQRLYVWGSSICIGVFCRILNSRGGRNKNG